MYSVYRMAEYHSKEWEYLIELGYITMYVENNIAYMLKKKGVK